ncbi:MAG: DMT family transporter [Pseudomonadota bacterium]
MADPADDARPRTLAARLYEIPALLGFLTALFWAGNAIAGQLAKGEIQPFMLVLVRWVAVALMLWPLFGHEVRAYWHVARPKFWRIVLTALTGFTVFNALFYVASLSTGAVNIGIFQGAIPIFVLIGTFLIYGDRVGPIQALGVAVTLVGVVLVATRGDLATALALGLNQGDGMMLMACVCYAAYTVALRGRPDMPGRAFFTLMCPIAAVASVPFAVGEALVTGGSWPTATGWLVAAYVAVFPSCLSQLFFLRAVDLIGPGRAGVYINLVPVLAACLAVLLLGEVFRWYHAAALVLVLGGIWLAQRPAPAATAKR